MADDFTVLEHTADIGLEARGESAKDVFRGAARALLFIAVEDSGIDERDTCRIDVSGDDYPSLLVNFLEEVLYLFDASRFAARDCAVDVLEPTRVVARLIGEPRDPARHPWKLIVKAVTYHGLHVTEDAGGWSARVFLDI